MIDVNKIKVGDKLRVVADYLKGIGVDEIVEVVQFVPDDYWINGGFVDINYLDGEEEAFELIDEELEQRIESEKITTQKIKVLTGDYEYQGLYKDSIHTLIGYEGDEYTSFCVFKHKGKTWKIDAQQCELVDDNQYYKELDKLVLPAKYLDPDADEETKKMLSAFKELIKKCGIEKDCVIFPGTAEELAEAVKPIKSDGGSSSYYTIPLPDDVIEKIVKNRAIETEDILKYGLGNDFDFANAAKSLVRLWGTVNGAGKAGNDAGYEIKKIRYSLGKIEKFFVNK